MAITTVEKSNYHIDGDTSIPTGPHTFCQQVNNVVSSELLQVIHFPDIPMHQFSSGPCQKIRNILDLPTELLLDVIHLLPDEPLHQFSFVSTRTHHLAYPIYLRAQLKRHNINLDHITSGTRTLLNKTIVRNLLHRALFIKAIPNLHDNLFYDLSCHLNRNRIRPCIEGVLALRVLLSGLESIPDIHLVHHAPRSPQPEWCEAVLGALETLEGKGCMHLTLRGAYSWKNYMLEVDVPPVNTLSRLGGLLKRKAQPYQPYPSTTTPSYRPVTTLKSLTLEYSDTFVSPPFLNWIISTISQSHGLTCVVLSRLALSVHQWSQLLPLISIQALSHLTLSSFTLSFTDLSTFLSRHSTLVMLDLRDGALLLNRLCSALLIPNLKLPRLETLHATPDYITQLFQRSPSFPLLREVTIEPFLKDFIPHAESNVIDHSLASLGRSQSSKQVHLTFSVLGHPTSSPVLPRASPSKLHCITSLHLKTWPATWSQHVSWEATALIPSWLTLFPELKEVKFDLCVLPFKKEEDRAAFAGRIKDVCPKIDKVCIAVSMPKSNEMEWKSM